MGDEEVRAIGTRWIAAILRAGLALSLGMLVLGVVISARAGAGEAERERPFDAWSAREPGAAIATAGILVLGATPALRVIALIVIWTREHDRRFALTACAVAIIVAVAALLGHG